MKRLTFIAAILIYIIFNGCVNFNSPSENAVNNFLKYIESDNVNKQIKARKYITPGYLLLLSANKFYKIKKWEIEFEENSNDSDSIVIVHVMAKTGNLLGVDLEHNMKFWVNRDNEIYDSDGFIYFEKFEDIKMSDLKKFNVIRNLKNLVKIEKWSWHQESYSYDVMAGEATIVNNSPIPISYLKAKIIYYDRKNRIINTDETYAVGGDKLMPGERKVFDWSTSHCYGARRASISLEF